MRMIDADELLDHLYNGVEYDRTVSDGIEKTDENIYAYKCGWNEALKTVSKWSPTVDAVEVVRCEDCRHWGGHKYSNSHETDFVCRYWESDGLMWNDFCSYGERNG